MPLLTPRTVYRPFEYPQFFEYFKRQNQMHWLPTEVPMESDVTDFRSKLTDAERSLVTNVLKFFTQGDLEVNDNYNSRLIPAFPKPEAKMMLSAFAAQEGIHVWAYAHLNDTLGLPDSEFSSFLDIPAMKAKYDFLRGRSWGTLEDIALNVAVFGAFMEGMSLYSSFAMLMSFQRFGKLKGVGQIVTWSVKDEALHANGNIELFNVLCAENPGLREAVEMRVRTAGDAMDKLECDFIDECFLAGPVEGINPEALKRYVRHLKDRRLMELGYSVDAPSPNPLPWMDVALNGKEHASFFEVRPTEYSKGSVTDDWTR